MDTYMVKTYRSQRIWPGQNSTGARYRSKLRGNTCTNADYHVMSWSGFWVSNCACAIARNAKEGEAAS